MTLIFDTLSCKCVTINESNMGCKQTISQLWHMIQCIIHIPHAHITYIHIPHVWKSVDCNYKSYGSNSTLQLTLPWLYTDKPTMQGIMLQCTWGWNTRWIALCCYLSEHTYDHVAILIMTYAYGLTSRFRKWVFADLRRYGFYTRHNREYRGGLILSLVGWWRYWRTDRQYNPLNVILGLQNKADRHVNSRRTASIPNTAIIVYLLVTFAFSSVQFFHIIDIEIQSSDGWVGKCTATGGCSVSEVTIRTEPNRQW